MAEAGDHRLRESLTDSIAQHEEVDFEGDDYEDEAEPLDSGSSQLSYSSVSFSKISSRVAEPEKGVALVRTARTLFTVAVGQDSAVGRQFHRWFVRDSKVIIVLFVLWYAGALLGVLALTPVVPRNCVWASLLMLPLPLMSLLVLSKDLVLQIIAELEFYVLTALQTVLLACAVGLLRDKRCIFWWCFAPTMGISCLVDAYPARFRSMFAKCFFTGTTLIFLAWNLMLVFRWCQWKASYYHVGYVTGSMAACSFTTQTTVLIFFIRHLACAYWHEDRYVLIRSHIRTRVADLRATVDSERGVTNVETVSTPREVKRSSTVRLSKLDKEKSGDDI